MVKNTKLAETRLHELLRCARTCAAKEIKLLPGGIEIILDSLLPTPLIRAAVSLQECYPDGGVYVTYLARSLILCVYYMED
jgi:hypothetical protein